MEAISPWTVYWILQLDSISVALGTFVVISLASALFVPLLAGLIFDLDEDDLRAILVKVWKPWAVLTLLAMLVGTFLPSTKTAAAIIVLPAIANNESIQREAGDLYDLAKQALRQAVTDDKPTKSTD